MAGDRMLAIATYASRSKDVASKLQQAHELGIPPGPCREPWSLAYLRAALPILAKTLPRAYLERIGESAHGFAVAMALRQVGDDLRPDWELVKAELRSIATAFDEYLGTPQPDPIPDALCPITPTSPGVIRYDELAQLVHPHGVARQRQAATAVESHCLRLASGGVTPEEIEWLRAMAHGERNIDIALRYGYSERAFYRSLRRLWGKLGVSGRVQALTLIGERGLLDHAPADAASA